MKNNIAGKIVMYLVGFVALAFVGFGLGRLSDAPSLKVTGINYADGDEIVVEVCGEVKNAGKYAVAKGTPLHDVIYMAGGISAKGDPESVDLGQLLTDSCTVTVGRLSSGDSAVVSESSYCEQFKCNINTASAAQLAKLPGIGESLARAIENHRSVYGDFKSIDELKNIKGIGDEKFAKFKDIITVGGES